MASIVNPLAQVASYRNQNLAPSVQGRGGATATTGVGLGRTAQQAMDAGRADTSGIDAISGSATRQHNLYLQAIQKQAMQRQAQQRQSYGGGGGGYSGSGGGPAGFGKYGLVEGADRALTGLNQAFQKQFGYNLQVNRGYRSYEDQARLYRLYKQGRGNLAAAPGKSVHQSGRAVDFGGGMQNARSREHRWMQQNAHLFGFKWTGKNFKQFEPWHWEWWG